MENDTAVHLMADVNFINIMSSIAKFKLPKRWKCMHPQQIRRPDNAFGNCIFCKGA